MKPPRFQYFDPRTLDEALELLAEQKDGAKVLAGGQSLVPMLNFRLLAPSCLIDINHIKELAGINDAGDDVAIGAMTRQRILEKSAKIARHLPLLAETMPQIAHFQIRNRGTIGGSLCHADPAAELPAIVTALNGRLLLASTQGKRTVKAEEFFVGYLATCLRPDELLTQILLPRQPSASGSAFAEVTRRHGDFALVGAAATVTLDDAGQCIAARIVITGAAETPFVSAEATQLLVGSPLDDKAINEAARLVAARLRPQSDIHASAGYRTHAAEVLTARTLKTASSRARDFHGAARA